MKGIRHTGIVVRDLNRAVAFYRDTFGFQPASQDRETGPFISALVGLDDVDVAWVKLTAPDGSMLELLQYHSHPDDAPHQPAPSNKVANAHLALTVTDVDALYQRFQELGLPTHGAPKTAPNGKARALYAHDPDGVILELVQEL